ncbi:hypothetical protein WR30_11120 [Burkholderia contaminans FFH2055]|uniref:YodC family protein n=1 Tax=Burkholderia contaminans TaxID=488447 RepID=UPI000624F7D8|nr:DUF2158 domain-containing protein [Burkholderia contaminans]KKL38602.1 hypothetical protein WR30_11120 [Burkholderia contaminans FFH2055]MEB4631147.1 DUF2158 domain-containing protein [Burkholderia contaminans]MEB4638005.1 DUF2158 domain-containing protein [Burkholderia contaminans]MEB4653089.1 DUF2158 domain-containing protein [Burkholderia contaminans]MEB4658125.1 DUF2158 domain-containing protein [Burkholderia contaminans]
MATFVKGDVVKLKSGGPKMTVSSTGDFSFTAGIQDGVQCVWFEGDKPHDKVFDGAVLEKAI